MAKLHDDIEIIQLELNFLKAQYEKAFRERDLRKLKGLSLWISKLEKKLIAARQKAEKKNIDYLTEYKNQKLFNLSHELLKTNSKVPA
jgi:hypothetical protein